MMKNFRLSAGPRRAALILSALTLSLVLASVAYATVREVGATSLFSAPVCDNNNCQVLTRTTAIQLKVGNRSNVSRVPHDGSAVAYTVHLPAVDNKRYTYFATTYGGAPTIRIAVLRRVPRKGMTKYRYQLVSQSPRLNVKRYLGGTPTFALPAPLGVKKGDVIGLTTDTWMPGFVVRPEDATSTWRASRPKGKCSRVGDDITNLATPRMHSTVDQIRRYECGYVGGRVLYHTTIVDTPPKTNK